MIHARPSGHLHFEASPATSPVRSPQPWGGASNRITPVYQYGRQPDLGERPPLVSKAALKCASRPTPATTRLAARPGATIAAARLPFRISIRSRHRWKFRDRPKYAVGSRRIVEPCFQTNNSPGRRKTPCFCRERNALSYLASEEASFYFKDDFKLTPSFTLNLGVRYEWYGVPTENHGKMLAR